jgi:Tfp pilus assembly protein PilX
MRIKTPRPRPSARDERGFSLIVAVVVMAAATLTLFAAIDAVFNNVQTTRTSLDQQRALLAAQAGLSAYEQQLSANQNFWTTCPGPNGTTGVTSTTGATGATVPGSTDDGSTESYTYANLPATGTTYTGCSTVNPIASTIQGSAGSAGTFRVKVVGYSRPTNGTNPISRTLVAQFQPNSFLNYVYFTNFEDEDPLYAVQPGGGNTPETEANCAVYQWAGRSSSLCQSIPFGVSDSVNGPLHSNDDVSCNSSSTTFGRSAADSIETPDTLASDGCTGTINGTQENSANGGWQQIPLPPDDSQLLEVADGGVSADNNGCYSGAGCTFSGPTTVVLDGPTSASNPENQITVTNAGIGSSSSGASACTTLNGIPNCRFNYPTNGVVYVNATSACSAYTYSPFGSENQLYGGTTLDSTTSDTDNAGCGDAVVQAAPYTGTANGTPYSTPTSCGNGTTSVDGVCPYTQSLTIGAANDIIVASSLTTTTNASASACSGEAGGCPTGTAILGLIADNMVRIFHPLTGVRNTDEEEYACPSTGNTNGTGSLVNPFIDAALFSVEDSFIIDNFDCGGTSGTTTALGNLTINGTIAQNFRGRIGESAGASTNYSGYVKNYWYDERLQSLEPPYFLNPVSVSWQVNWVTECDTTASC